MSFLKLLTVASIATGICLAADSVKEFEDFSNKITFGLSEIGYEYSAPNAPYVNTNISAMQIISLDKNKKNDLNIYINGEAKLGYCFRLSNADKLIPFAHIGHTSYFYEDAQHHTIRWSYAGIGLKYMHRFGDLFEMGIAAQINQSLNEVFEWRMHEYSESKLKAYEEISMPLIWHVGEKKEWEISAEPFYHHMPDVIIKRSIGSKFSFGYKF